jgi:hypothetical protein
MQTPNGYSWMAEPWVSTGALVSRMNFALVLSGNRVPGVQTDWTRLLSGTGSVVNASLSTDETEAAAAAKETKLEKALLGQAVSDRTRATVLQQFQDTKAQQEAEKNFPIRATEQEPMAGVLNAVGPTPLVRPQQDRQAAVMAGLLLGSPEFQRR